MGIRSRGLTIGWDGGVGVELGAARREGASVTARPIDGAEGYAFFLRHDGAVELDEINEYLRGNGLRDVRPRMLVHYRKLQRYGYSGYITQNRLDLAVAGEHAWSDDMRALYPELRRDVPAEIVDGAVTRSVSVHRLTAVAATVLDDDPPPAGRTVVLRLTASGIERVGVVSRTDRQSARFDLAFDPYSSLPVSAADSPFSARLVFDLPKEAETVVAISDLLLHLERTLARLDRSGTEVARVTSIRMSSPLEIQLTGNQTVDLLVKLAAAVLALRHLHYQTRKTKAEAEGQEFDNEQKLRALQRESDRALLSELEAEEASVETPLLDRVSVEGVDKGQPGSMTRRQFIESVRSVLMLPASMTVRRPKRSK